MFVIKAIFNAINSCIKYINTYFKTFVLLFIFVFFVLLANFASSDTSFANLQRIYINGAILDSTQLVDEIYAARDNELIKGVLLDINSPGGAAAASMEIALAIDDLSKKKPVVAYARDYMTSGSYLAASSSSYIIANPISTIGSIGVLVSSADISKALEKLGIKASNLSAGKYKQISNISKPLSKDEQAYIQAHIDKVYMIFADFVAKQRSLDMKDMSAWADARIFVSKEALEVGLIDEVANIKRAEEKLKELSKVDEAVFKEENSYNQSFIKTLSSDVSKALSEILMQTILH